MDLCEMAELVLYGCYCLFLYLFLVFLSVLINRCSFRSVWVNLLVLVCLFKPVCLSLLFGSFWLSGLFGLKVSLIVWLDC